jgi:hypothetical protein
MYLTFKNTKVPTAELKKANNPSKAPTNKKTNLFQLVQTAQSNPSVGEPSMSNQVPEVLEGLCPISHALRPPF